MLADSFIEYAAGYSKEGVTTEDIEKALSEADGSMDMSDFDEDELEDD